MNEQQPEFEERMQGMDHGPAPGPRRRLNTEVIAAGLKYLLAQHQDRHWRRCGLPAGEVDGWTTAYVLARLGDLPPQFICHALRERMTESLSWLLKTRASEGGWAGSFGANEADTTAWAVIALVRNGYAAPDAALRLIQRCRRPDGGFAARPEDVSAPDLTVVAVQTLGAIDSSSESFLSSCLQNHAVGLAVQLSVCAGILDWDKSLAPVALLNQACQLTAHFRAESALEQALLLRCLVRLRLTRAWTLADSLRAMQRADGSWPGSAGQAAGEVRCDEKNIIPTVTAVSALVLGESQPGLYFGSDLPRPRRLHES